MVVGEPENQEIIELVHERDTWMMLAEERSVEIRQKGQENARLQRENSCYITMYRESITDNSNLKLRIQILEQDCEVIHALKVIRDFLCSSDEADTEERHARE